MKLVFAYIKLLGHALHGVFHHLESFFGAWQYANGGIVIGQSFIAVMVGHITI
jgi:hypothetical protein